MGCNSSVQTEQSQVCKKSDTNISESEKKQLEQITGFTVIRENYIFDKVLGQGGFGLVKLGRMKSNEKKQVAIKCIEKSKLKNKQYLMLRELEVLKQLDHPNIIKFYEVYQDAVWFYIVMEYCSGGELMNSIKKKKFYKEKEAARILHKLFSAVNHMHSKGIVHRDLKPENVMFTTNETDSEIKIIDFGLSGKYENQPQLLMGTPFYIAPEVLEGTSIDESCDMWSLGVIMYMLISGYLPFTGVSQEEVFHKIQNAIYSLTTQDWQRVSASAKDLIIKLLVKDPEKRLKSNQAFKHPWFQEVNKRISRIENMATIDPVIINMLKKYKTTGKFKTEVIKLFVNYLDEDEINEIKKAFQIIDKDHTGVISINELQIVIENSGVKMDKDQLVQIFRSISQDHENPDHQLQIKYSEFIAATLNQGKYLTKQKLLGLFNYLDSSNTDVITQKNLIDMFARHGQIKTVEEVRIMIQEVDLNKDGLIQFNEFEALMNRN